MKKSLWLVSIVLMLALLSGCEDVKPSNWDITGTGGETWEVWGKGTIVDISDTVSDRCGSSYPCSNHNCKAYKFDNGKVVKLRFVRNPGTIEAGQKGTLYRCMRVDKEDTNAWFQWILDSKATSIPTKERKTLKVADEPNALNINVVNVSSSPWIDSRKETPERYNEVAVKFKDGTKSIGYITNINEWKLSIHKLEDNGGATISNSDIIQWKKVDLN